MARKSGVQIVAIVEDQQLERFVRRTLEAYGFDLSKVRFRSYPGSGSGSGKQRVENIYRAEAVTYRKKARENRALLLGTEADEQTVDERVRTLDAQYTRTATDAIVYWIPRWHVETWGLHLTGTDVDEKTQYKGRSIDWREAGQGFRREHAAFKQGNLSTLPSLERAYGETERLPGI